MPAKKSKKFNDESDMLKEIESLPVSKASKKTKSPTLYMQKLEDEIHALNEAYNIALPKAKRYDQIVRLLKQQDEYIKKANHIDKLMDAFWQNKSRSSDGDDENFAK